MVGMLKWWFIFVCSVLVVAALASYGLVSKLWAFDVYKVSFVTLSYYFACSLFTGWVTWCAVHNKKPQIAVTLLVHTEDLYDEILQDMPDGMTALGLIGTVIGFIMMLAAFTAGTDATQLQESTSKMIAGGVIALSNTLVGLICSRLMKFQVLNLGLVKNSL